MPEDRIPFPDGPANQGRDRRTGGAGKFGNTSEFMTDAILLVFPRDRIPVDGIPVGPGYWPGSSGRPGAAPGSSRRCAGAED